MLLFHEKYMLTFILMAAKHGPGATKARKVNGTKKKQLEEQVKMIGLKKKKSVLNRQSFPESKMGRGSAICTKQHAQLVEQVQNNFFNVKLKRF